MRTLQSQMRLRRLLRVHAELSSRLVAEPGDVLLAGAARDRLLRLTADLRSAWTYESAQDAPPGSGSQSSPGPPEALRRHVSRALAAIEAAVAAIDRPGADQQRRAAEFEESALPLMFCLRGLEQVPEAQLTALLTPDLARSA